MRFMHVHRNEPGILHNINTTLSRHGLNITAQYLQTDGELGYVVIEAEGAADGQVVLEELRSIPGTIRTRLLYET
jgi:D-3-phosphoglycerate dehydrogenase